MNFFGFNIQGNGVHDKQKLIKYVSQLQPNWLLVMDNADLLYDLWVASPNTKFIWRMWPDDDNHRRWNHPRDWFAKLTGALDNRHSQMRESLYFLTNNEPPFHDAMQWEIDCINYALERDLKVASYGLGVGRYPDSEEGWSKADEFLRLINENSDDVVLCLHEYGGGDIFNGMFDPPIPEEINVPLYTIGRVKFLVDYCEKNGLHNVRVVISEFGWDWLDNIADYLWSLPVDNAEFPRGPYSLYTHWQDRFNGIPHHEAMFEQFAASFDLVYEKLLKYVEAGLYFSYGSQNIQEWRTYNLEGDNSFLNRLLRGGARFKVGAPSPKPTPTPTPTPTPSPGPPDDVFEAGLYEVEQLPNNWRYMNVRSVPEGDFIDGVEIRKTDAIKIEANNIIASGNRYYKVYLPRYEQEAYLKYIGGLSLVPRSIAITNALLVEEIANRLGVNL